MMHNIKMNMCICTDFFSERQAAFRSVLLSEGELIIKCDVCGGARTAQMKKSMNTNAMLVAERNALRDDLCLDARRIAKLGSLSEKSKYLHYVIIPKIKRIRALKLQLGEDVEIEDLLLNEQKNKEMLQKKSAFAGSDSSVTLADLEKAVRNVHEDFFEAVQSSKKDDKYILTSFPDTKVDAKDISDLVIKFGSLVAYAWLNDVPMVIVPKGMACKTEVELTIHD